MFPVFDKSDEYSSSLIFGQMFMFGPNVTFAGISNHYVHMCIPTKSVFACQPRGVGRYARALVDAGFCVLAFGLYGHGATDAPDMELAPRMSANKEISETNFSRSVETQNYDFLLKLNL